MTRASHSRKPCVNQSSGSKVIAIGSRAHIRNASQSKNLKHATQIHTQIITANYAFHPILFNNLLLLYAKCCSIHRCLPFFTSTPPFSLDLKKRELTFRSENQRGRDNTSTSAEQRKKPVKKKPYGEGTRGENQDEEKIPKDATFDDKKKKKSGWVETFEEQEWQVSHYGGGSQRCQQREQRVCCSRSPYVTLTTLLLG
ncbi:hypothetical protein PIB30_011401 [Stylosanthes scabra]|uniref:Uncharacterized protein n=1 Tax=Stylosanthes scabra TaxID=79078 RepID=A0ABU6Z3J0_9FABA|nr:hypothetical protein [Stylosanthes scabra]